MPTGTPLKSLCQVVAAHVPRRSAHQGCPPEAGRTSHKVSNDKIDSTPASKIAHTSDWEVSRQGGRRHAVGHGGRGRSDDLVEVVHRDSRWRAQDPARLLPVLDHQRRR
ncbi:hypothetical protein ZWY2020_030230 [Hordeum vulgare]|nr:hypothetical protein ZWY2020_030230 [Hordeum vulgare]